MKRKCILLFALLGVCSTAFCSEPSLLRRGPVGSSSYTAGIGLRGGIMSGLTAKYFISDYGAVEGILSPRLYDGSWFTGLYEYHVEAFGVTGLRWYYGGGAHIGVFKKSSVVGLDGILGLEYKIFELPFTLHLDVKPMLNFNYSRTILLDAALGVRVVF
jgi:hypothetical protein